MVKKLLENGADVNLSNRHRMTALMHASRKMQCFIIKSLKELKNIMDENRIYHSMIGLDFNESKLPNVIKRNLLEKIGDGLYRHTGKQENEINALNTKTRQGFLENSNVTAVEEMTEMIGTLRIFESYQKIIQSIDSMNDQSVNTIGRVG